MDTARAAGVPYTLSNLFTNQRCCPQLGFSPNEPSSTFTTNTRISKLALTTRSLVTLRRFLRSPSLTCHTLHIADWVQGSPNIRPAGSTEDWLASKHLRRPLCPPPCLSTIQPTQSGAAAAAGSANEVWAAGPAL